VLVTGASDSTVRVYDVKSGKNTAMIVFKPLAEWFDYCRNKRVLCLLFLQ